MKDDHILSPVLQAYGLHADSVASGGGTAGRTWRVEAGGRRYFVRQRGARTASRHRVAFDHGLRKHLAQRGFPTVPPLEAADGRTRIVIRGDVFEAYDYVEGRTFAPDLMARVRRTTAETLARFHELARSYDAPCEPLVPQYTSYPADIAPRACFDAPDAQQEAVAFLIDRHGTSENRPVLDRAREYAAWVGVQYERGYPGLVHWVTHGDYNCFNLLFEPADAVTPSVGVVGVFDFDWAWREIRLLDVAQGMFFFGTRRTGEFDPGSIWSLTRCPCFDLETMLEFVTAYHAQSPLTNAECEALPIVMLARWISWRLEGAMKVPAERRAEFFLYGLFEPFEWYEREATVLTKALLNAGMERKR
jgi:Ser/Thr protein kinase RdoA (MazF antagonist)